jgi:hypothetical protein
VGPQSQPSVKQHTCSLCPYRSNVSKYVLSNRCIEPRLEHLGGRRAILRNSDVFVNGTKPRIDESRALLVRILMRHGNADDRR